MERRHRLSRSRDFDAVYRRGRSASTRSLVLYWFDRQEEDDAGEPRLGIAVSKKLGGAVARNRIKRQLKEAWRAQPSGLLPGELAPGRDYVLVARPGLIEAAEAQGFDWLRGRVAAVLGKAGS